MPPRSRRKKIMVRDGGFLEVLGIALPLILSSSCHAVNMFVDRLMLARHSQEAVAAAFTGGLTNFTIACIFVGTAGYTGTFVAQYEGARHRERIGSAVWQGLWIAFVGSCLLATGAWWGEALFNCFGHESEVTHQEAIYFAILSKGVFVLLFSAVLACFWTGRGRTEMVLWISILVTFFNIPLNYLLIFGKCGFPEYGVAGAALGTVYSEMIGLAIYFVCFLLPSSQRHFKTWNFRPDFALIGRMLRFGLPNGIQLALDLISFNTFSLVLGCYGVSIMEASSITFGINNIAICPVLGIGSTALILVGQAIGAENVPLAKRSVRSSLILTQLYTFLMILLFTVFQEWVLVPFARPDDPSQAEAMHYARIMLYFISAYLFFDGFNIVLSHSIRGAGDTKFPMWTMTVVGLIGFAVPCLVMYHLDVPWWGHWIALVSYIVLLCGIFIWRYLGGKWTTMRVIEESAVHGEESGEACAAAE